MKDMLKEVVATWMGKPLSEFSAIEESTALRELEEMCWCKDLIKTLAHEFRGEFSNRAFYRWRSQPEDIHIAWGFKFPTSIQVDPLCEVICAFGAEFGAWTPSDRPVEQLIACVRSHSLKPVSSASEITSGESEP